MTEQLEQTLSKVIEKSLKLAEETGNFVIDQAPDLLQQFYAWHITESSFYLLIGVILLIVTILLPRLWGRPEVGHTCDRKFLGKYYAFNDEFDAIPIIGTYLVGGFISIPIIIINTLDLLKLLVAPKLYLIEYFIK